MIDILSSAIMNNIYHSVILSTNYCLLSLNRRKMKFIASFNGLTALRLLYTRIGIAFRYCQFIQTSNDSNGGNVSTNIRPEIYTCLK